MRESVQLLFKTARNIDSIQTEYFDDGTTCERSPRNWARSLQLDDQYQGIDLANGAADGLVVLIVPAEVVDFAKEQLRLYELVRQYPVLGGATHFYETSKLDPSIPETVFTTNITFLLSRENKSGSKKTATPQIPKVNAWTKQQNKQKKTSVTVAATSPDYTVTTLQQKNEMLQAHINALEEEKASNSSQSITSDSTESTPAEETTLMLESVQTICERMFSDRMLQIERMRENSDRKVQLMFEKLLNKQVSTADVSNPVLETSRALTTVENGLVLLQDTRKKRQIRNDLPSPATTPTNIDPNTPQYKSMETDEDDQC